MGACLCGMGIASPLMWMALAALGLGSLTGCASRENWGSLGGDRSSQLIVDAQEQTLTLYREGSKEKKYEVSTSKYGLGDQKGSYRTPTGKLQVAEKIGDRAPAGAVFKSRRTTGEVLKPDAPGRDPIVTRILWLRGTEAANQNAFGRCIYIHGTPEERNIGRAVSYGCIRMRSRDVIDLFDRVGEGASVYVAQSTRERNRFVATNVVPRKLSKPQKFEDVEDAVLPLDPAEAETEVQLAALPAPGPGPSVTPVDGIPKLTARPSFQTLPAANLPRRLDPDLGEPADKPSLEKFLPKKPSVAAVMHSGDRPARLPSS